MTIYNLYLWRFGGTIEISADNEIKGKDLVMEKYKEIFRNTNEEDPTPEELERAEQDIEVYEHELNVAVFY